MISSIELLNFKGGRRITMFENINNMFENTGKTLKIIARIVFWLGEIGAIVCAIIFGRTMDRYGDLTFHFGSFLTILLGMAIAVVVSSILLYGFGIVIEAMEQIQYNSDKITLTTVKGYYNRDDGAWICPKCYTVNEKDKDSIHQSSCCKNCGTYHFKSDE